MTQMDAWRTIRPKADVILEDDGGRYRYTAATSHPESTVYRIDKWNGNRRKVIGPRNKTQWAI